MDPRLNNVVNAIMTAFPPTLHPSITHQVLGGSPFVQIQFQCGYLVQSLDIKAIVDCFQMVLGIGYFNSHADEPYEPCITVW